MRVTNKQLLNVVTRSVAASSQQLLKAQEKVSSMKRINRPSDDPIGMSKILDYRKKLASIDQYVRNIDSAKIRVETTVANLEDVYDLLSTAKDIATVQSSANDVSGRETAAREIGNIYEQVRSAANMRLGGSYMIAGHSADTVPFPRDKVTTRGASDLDGGEYFGINTSTTEYYVWYDLDNASSDPAVPGRTGIEVDISTGYSAEQVAAATKAAIDALPEFNASILGADVTITTANDGKGVDVSDGNAEFGFHNATYNGDSGAIKTILGEGISMKINAHGNEVFTGSGVSGGVNILGILEALKDSLESSTYDASTIRKQAGDLKKGMSQVEKITSQQSTTFKRLEQTEDHWNYLKYKFQNVLSETEDADATQVVVELQAQETAYEMTLAAASSVLKKNLLDFLA